MTKPSSNHSKITPKNNSPRPCRKTTGFWHVPRSWKLPGLGGSSWRCRMTLRTCPPNRTTPTDCSLWTWWEQMQCKSENCWILRFASEKEERTLFVHFKNCWYEKENVFCFFKNCWLEKEKRERFLFLQKLLMQEKKNALLLQKLLVWEKTLPSKNCWLEKRERFVPSKIVSVKNRGKRTLFLLLQKC